jgi:hypothetical protein
VSEAERLAAQVVNDCDHLDCNVVGACRTCVFRALAAERARAIAEVADLLEGELVRDEGAYVYCRSCCLITGKPTPPRHRTTCPVALVRLHGTTRRQLD